jgi:DNA-binding transcriptional regulator YhcF (GntR family)
MCVADGAREKITTRRKSIFLNQTIDVLLTESETLGISLDELISVIKNRKGANNYD